MGQITLPTGAASSTPTAGNVVIYSKTSDKKLYYKDETGTETLISSGGGGSGNTTQTVTFAAASSAINLALGNVVNISTLVTADLTFATPTNPSVGLVAFSWQQDTVGGWTITLPGGITSTGGIPSEKQAAVFLYNGTDYIQIK